MPQSIEADSGTDESLMRRCQYDPAGMTPRDLMRVSGLIAQLHHLQTHPAGAAAVIRQLPAIRRAVPAVYAFAREET